MKAVVNPIGDGTHGQRSVPISHSSHRTTTSSFYTYGYGSTPSPLDVYGFHRSSLTSSPERLHRGSDNTLLNVVPEDAIMMEFPTSSTSERTRTPLYTGNTPLLDNSDDETDEEEAERELDEELEEQGLYRGSYRRLVLLYTLTPVTFVVILTLLAVLPYVLYPTTPTWPYPSAPYLPHPVPELLTSSALFALSHLLRDPVASLVASLITSLSSSPISSVITILITVVHTFISLVLQQSALPLLLVAQHTPERPTTRDAAFRRVWWLALGWAAAEAFVSIKQGYEARALYRDVLVTVRRTDATGKDKDIEAERTTKVVGQEGEISAMGRIGDARSLSGSRSRSPLGANGPLDRKPPEEPSSLPTSPPLGLVREGQGQSTLELFERAVDDDVYDHERHSSQPFAEEADGERQPLLQRSVPWRLEKNGKSQEIKNLVEDELEELLAIRDREELEAAYGVPVIHIPVFISCLQRVNALLLALGVSLLLAHAYLRSTFASLYLPSPPSLSPHIFTVHSPPSRLSFTKEFQRSNRAMQLTFPIVFLVQFYLNLLHTPLVLPRMGVPAVVYSGSLVSLSAFFAGLAIWEGLS